VVFPIFQLSPFPGEGKGFGVKVEALSYGKRGLGELRHPSVGGKKQFDGAAIFNNRVG
jgi:hypothetical protein